MLFLRSLVKREKIFIHSKRRIQMAKMKKLAVAFAAIFLSSSAMAADETLMMATTTSTQDTGLLEYLQPYFKKDTGINLKWVSVGTGKALELAKNCDAEVLLVHAPAAEKKFVEDGNAIDRRQIMYNDFVLIGPKDDPAGLKGQKVVDAFKAINDKSATFVSRGDESGTHKAEQKLWKDAGVDSANNKNYVSAGSGMMATIRMSAEKKGYALTDRGTWIKFSNQEGANNPLDIIVEGDAQLRNQYSVLTTNPAQCPKVQKELAKKFEDWWVSPQTQKLIDDFRVEGKQLFFSNANEK